MTVILIIGILVAIAILMYNNSSEKAKATVCADNRAAIERVYIAYHRSNPSCAGHDFMDGNCPNVEDNIENYTCPAGGEYSYNAAGYQMICSIHGPEPVAGPEPEPEPEPEPTNPGNPENPNPPTPDPGGGTPGGGTVPETVPGTNVPLVGSYWPEQSDFPLEWSTFNIKAGGVFRYTDGELYVVTKDTTVTKGQAASGPGGDVYNWYNTQKITGRTIVFPSGSNQVNNAQRGDIYVVGNDVYVWTDGGSWATRPEVDPSKWYKL